MSNLNTLLTSSVGVASIEAVQYSEPFISQHTNEIVSTLLQVVIGIVTLFKLFKKKD